MKTKSPQWILEFDPVFTDPARIAELVSEPILLPKTMIGMEEWPTLEPPFVAFGTIQKMIRLSRQPKIGAAVFDSYSSLRCSSYYRFVYKFLGRMAFLVPFSALPFLDLKKLFGEKVFIRPDGNTKSFQGEIQPVEEINRFIKQYPEQKEELIVLSEVVDLGIEYRCFCRQGKVFCHSSYPGTPYIPAPQEVIQFAEEVARELACFFSSPIFTIDVGKNENCLYLIEIGGVNSWGIYGANIQDFIKGMEAEALMRYEECL